MSTCPLTSKFTWSRPISFMYKQSFCQNLRTLLFGKSCNDCPLVVLQVGLTTGLQIEVILLSSLPWVSRLIAKTQTNTHRPSYSWLVDLVVSKEGSCPERAIQSIYSGFQCESNIGLQPVNACRGTILRYFHLRASTSVPSTEACISD
jgi:hypothetical protein